MEQQWPSTLKEAGLTEIGDATINISRVSARNAPAEEEEAATLL
jgi:hypothetical protein